MGGGIFLLGPYFHLFSKIKGSKIGDTKLHLPPSDAPHRELFVVGLGFIVALTARW